ncbi:MAG TPA: hypothetical protein VGB52_08325 [Actinomycetota bacterium]
MVVRMRAFALLGAMALLGGLLGGVANAAEIELDLSSPTAIDEDLGSIGVDPSDAVIQQSRLNYAGPDCPGAGWACTSAAGPVVQISDGGLNIFEGAGGAADPNTCIVVQDNTTGSNDATCSLSTTTNGTTQQVRITQTNDAGDNNADVDVVGAVSQSIVVDLTASFDQTLRQEVQVSQESGAGANNASIVEDLDLGAEARAVGTATSKQDGYGIVLLDQVSGTGNQTADVSQDQDLISRFTDISGSVRQEQQTSATDRNIVAFLNQNTFGGTNDIEFGQDQTLTLDANNVLGAITNIQGNEAGGMLGNIDTDSDTGTSHYDARQTKAMIADDQAGVAIQADDPDCCDLLNLVPHTPTTCTITEIVSLIGPANAQQDAFLHGRAFAEENCDVTLTVSLMAGKVQPTVITEQRNGTFVDTTIDCEDGACVTDDRPQEEGSAAALHLAIRNQSDGQAFDANDAQRPGFTSGDAGEVLELKIEFHNHTSGPVDDLTMWMQVPAGTTFLSCSACAGGAPDANDRVTFNRGIGEPGGKRKGTFRVVVGGPRGMYTSQAMASSDHGMVDSNTIRYWIS